MGGNSYGSLNAFGGAGSSSSNRVSLNYGDNTSLGGFYVLYDELAENAEKVKWVLLKNENINFHFSLIPFFSWLLLGTGNAEWRRWWWFKNEWATKGRTKHEVIRKSRMEVISSGDLYSYAQFISVHHSLFYFLLILLLQ